MIKDGPRASRIILLKGEGSKKLGYCQTLLRRGNQSGGLDSGGQGLTKAPSPDGFLLPSLLGHYETGFDQTYGKPPWGNSPST